jgi:hypothetical protein
MPRIHSTSYSADFDAMHNESRSVLETNDCAVKAVAMSCDVDYMTAHRMLASFGRKNRKGTYRHMTKRAVEALGFNIRVWGRNEHRQVIDSYPTAHRILKSITTHHPRRFAQVWAQPHLNKTYLFFCSRHVAVVKGGQLHDWTVNSAKPVIEIWEISKK